MCGIAGIISLNRPLNQCVESIKKMNNILAHRGPDGAGVWSRSDSNVFFGHRRLSIIDLSNYAAQPMISSDGRFVITYNGEIYNYKELRAACEKLGSYFRSHSDTEVILESFRHWGTEAFKKFKGMWAFAIYDQKNQCVIFSRDPFGIKPLYFGYDQGDLYFASEPKALWKVAESFKVIDEVSVKLFVELGFLDRDDWTFFKNIKRFPHAHYAEITLDKRDNKLNFHRYWTPPQTEISISMKDAAEELKRLLIQSVTLHLRSDVTVGACLSGGLDSSTITCIASNQLPPNQKLNTFTVHYPNNLEVNEGEWAKKIIKCTAANGRFCEPTYESLNNNFDHLLYMQDEPFGSTSIFAQYSIFKEIAKTPVKVMLDGQGSDEMLAGYHGFIPQYLQSLTGIGQVMTYFKEGFLLRKNYNIDFKLKDVLRILKTKKCNNNIQDKAQLYPNQWSALSTETYEERLNKLTRFNSTYFPDVLTALLCETNIPQLLRYEDRNSMAFSIESRVPFLETELVNFILSLPVKLKIHNGLTKAVLRESIKDIVPREVIDRIDKFGFPTPERKWVKQLTGVEISNNGSLDWRKYVTKKWYDSIMKNVSESKKLEVIT